MGEPKTGTTFLQEVLWANRAELARRGVLLPGYGRRDHSRASRDLRAAPWDPADQAEPFSGEWDVLARQALRVRGAAVISDEVLAACTPHQAERAVLSLQPAEVHVVATVRDFGSLLPAEWQETVKCRSTLAWEPWLAGVIDASSSPGRRGLSMFWAMHDTLANLAMWSLHIPPDHVHVVIMPRGDGRAALWHRFASVLGIDPGGVDLAAARTNASLGVTETEFLRCVNAALPDDMPYWFYTRQIKRVVAHGALAARPRTDRLVLPPEVQPWAMGQSQALVAGLRDSRYHIVGELDELLPTPAAERYEAPAIRSAELVTKAAALTVAALADDRFRELRARRSRLAWARGWPGPAQLAWQLLSNWRLRRLLRRHSHRAVVRRLRVAIWCLLFRPSRSAPPARRRPGLAGVPQAMRLAHYRGSHSHGARVVRGSAPGEVPAQVTVLNEEQVVAAQDSRAS